MALSPLDVHPLSREEQNVFGYAQLFIDYLLQTNFGEGNADFLFVPKKQLIFGENKPTPRVLQELQKLYARLGWDVMLDTEGQWKEVLKFRNPFK